MQAKGAVILIREPRMRALGVQHLEEAIDVVLAVCGPFVAVDGKEADARIGQERAPALRTGPLRGFLRPDIAGDVVEQALQKSSELAIAGRPIATRVRLDGLIKMAERRHELKRLEKLMDLVVGLRELNLVG